jgi:hypothetical protein
VYSVYSAVESRKEFQNSADLSAFFALFCGKFGRWIRRTGILIRDGQPEQIADLGSDSAPAFKADASAFAKQTVVRNGV